MSSQPRQQTSRKRTTTKSENKPKREVRSNPFALSESRYRRSVENEYYNPSDRDSYHRGPVGLGQGKGGIRRLQRHVRREERSIPTLRSIENNPDRERSIPLAPFARLVRMILENVGEEFKKDNDDKPFRIQPGTLNALQEAAEGFLIEMFETSSLFIAHAGRVTLMPKDLVLFNRLATNINDKEK